MKLGICWLCGKQKKVLQTTVDGHHRWLCKKCENINKDFKTQEGK
jgi:transposase-like protein